MFDLVVIFFMDVRGRLRYVKIIFIFLNMLELVFCVVLNYLVLSVVIRGKVELIDGISIIRYYSVRV